MHRYLFLSTSLFQQLSRASVLSFSSLVASSTSKLKTDARTFLYRYLIEACGLSASEASAAQSQLPKIASSERFDSTINIFQQFGFKKAHVRDLVRIFPRILFANDKNALMPKLRILQEMGVTGSDLCAVVSRNPKLLLTNFEQTLIPCIKILKETLHGDDRAVIQVLKICKWVLYKDPHRRLLPNISFLKSCGIVGTQLSTLLKRQPALFVTSELRLIGLVNKAVEMGVSTSSRMFVHALYTFSCMRPETFDRKIVILHCYGLTEEHLKIMFQRAPSVLRMSETKLRRGLEFFLNVAGIDRIVLVNRATCLMHSLDKRIMPRYELIQLLRSTLHREQKLKIVHLIQMSESKFLKYILKFDRHKELIEAYKCQDFPLLQAGVKYSSDSQGVHSY